MEKIIVIKEKLNGKKTTLKDRYNASLGFFCMALLQWVALHVHFWFSFFKDYNSLTHELLWKHRDRLFFPHSCLFCAQAHPWSMCQSTDLSMWNRKWIYFLKNTICIILWKLVLSMLLCSCTSLHLNICMILIIQVSAIPSWCCFQICSCCSPATLELFSNNSWLLTKEWRSNLLCVIYKSIMHPYLKCYMEF